MKLYELTGQYNELLDLIESGEIEGEIAQDTLELLEGEIEFKVESIGKIVKQLDIDSKTIKEEEKRLETKRKSYEKQKDFLKNYLEGQLPKIKDQKVKTPLITVSLKKNPPAVEITDENLIPTKYFVVIPEDKKPDKNAIKEDIKNGIDVPGAKLVQGISVSIK